MISQYGNTTTQAQTQLAWTTLNCTNELACSYKDTFKQGSRPKEYVDPTSCPTLNGTETGTTIPPSGTTLEQSSTTSQSAEADFNTSAIFLKKYMELDEEDKFAIGHRLS
jgi:hypothetical protein